MMGITVPLTEVKKLRGQRGSQELSLTSLTPRPVSFHDDLDIFKSRNCLALCFRLKADILNSQRPNPEISATIS